jgi:hypothetical protein
MEENEMLNLLDLVSLSLYPLPADGAADIFI